MDDDEIFLTLYRELYYRHIYSKLQPTLEQRIEVGWVSVWLACCDPCSLSNCGEGGSLLFPLVHAPLPPFVRSQPHVCCTPGFHLVHPTPPTSQSFHTYIDLFSIILDRDGPVPLALPNVWLWDMIDEFIYQFQSFSVRASSMGVFFLYLIDLMLDRRRCDACSSPSAHRTPPPFFLLKIGNHVGLPWEAQGKDGRGDFGAQGQPPRLGHSG